MTDKMEIDRLDVDVIRVGEHRRAIEPEKVEALAKSIHDIGLRTPITVWVENLKAFSVTHLVSGLHRLEACKQLGMDYIEAFIISGDEWSRDLWQIDENLMRADLTDLERADHISRRGKIIKAQKKLSAKLANNSKRGPKDTGQVEFVATTAALTLQSIRAVERDKRRGDLIADDVKDAIKDMSAANIGVELDAIASLWEKDQRRAVERVKSGASKNFREAKAFFWGELDKQRADEDRAMKAEVEAAYTKKDRMQFEAMKRAWSEASDNAREMFKDWLPDDD